jgi:hypothetical protein
MYRAAARRVCRRRGMGRDEAQQPPPRCRLPHLAIATGVGWLRSFWFSTAPARAPGVSALRPQSSTMRTPVSRIVFHMKGVRRTSICSWMSGDIGVDAVDPAEHVRAQKSVMVGEMPVERSAQPNLTVAYLDKGVDSKYGSTADQGRTGREDSSSRLWRPAQSLGTHAKQSPSTGHSVVGLRQAGKCLLTPRPHFTAPACTLGNQVVGALDGAPFRQERRPTGVYGTPGAGTGLLAEAITLRAGGRVLGWRSHRRAGARRPAAHCPPAPPSYRYPLALSRSQRLNRSPACLDSTCTTGLTSALPATTRPVIGSSRAPTPASTSTHSTS